MAANRAFRLKLLLGIDTSFFVLELVVGMLSGSLALMADAFHMLNDVISLVVALQALKLAENSTSSSKYSYGWQRAEVLGALINGVFLLALCFSIGLEAVNRLVTVPEVTNPKLIVIVGSAGLVSNIVGLFLFHDHGHSHGGHSHGHDHGHSHGKKSAPKKKLSGGEGSRIASDGLLGTGERTPLLGNGHTAPSTPSRNGAETPMSVGTVDDELNASDSAAESNLFVHPGEFRDNIVKTAHEISYRTSEQARQQAETRARRASESSHHGHGHFDDSDDEHDHSGHAHEHGHDEHDEDGHGHAHGHNADGSMNMRGVFLHVLGDALGNVGVIAAGLFIWLSPFSWRMYTDPVISLIITCIIFSSALPLVKSASFILLQGVPSSVPLDRLRARIAKCPGVINVHELHVWSLSESKSVASVHIMTHKADFVSTSKEIRKILHKFGIHSSTIQPEIVAADGVDGAGGHVDIKNALSLDPEQDSCFVGCVNESCRENACCPTPPPPQQQQQQGSQGQGAPAAHVAVDMEAGRQHSARP